MKGLRTNLGIPPTHIDREWTNDKVMKKANEEAGTNMIDPNETPKIKNVFSIIHNKRLTLLGHILRSDANDPLREVTFENQNLKPLTPALKIVGRLRSKGIETTTKEAWQTMSDDDFINSEAQRAEINMQALRRTALF